MNKYIKKYCKVQSQRLTFCKVLQIQFSFLQCDLTFFEETNLTFFRKSKISSEMKPVSFWFRMYNCNKSKTNFWFLMYNCNRSKLNILNETFVLYSGGSNSERPISDGRWFSDCSQDHSKPEQLNLAVSLDRFTNKENIYLCLKSSRPTAIYFSSDGTFKN